MNVLSLPVLVLGLFCAAPAASTVLPAPATAPGQESPRQARGWLGVSLRDQGGRVAITDVQAGSPAESAGLRVGDRILSVEGRELESYSDLTAALGRFEPGDTVSIEVGRETEVELGHHPDTGSTWLGVTLDGDDEDVVFTSVLVGSPADAASLTSGDRVLAIAGTEVRTVQEAIDRIRDHAPGDRIGITVRRRVDPRLGRRDRQATENRPRADRPHRPERPERSRRPAPTSRPTPPSRPGHAEHDAHGRGYLGIQVSGDEGEDPVVAGKVDGGPADRGGLEVGQRIVSIDGRRTDTVADVFEILEATQPGERVEVLVIGPEGEGESHTIRLGRRDRVFTGDSSFEIPGVDREQWDRWQNDLRDGMEKLHREWSDSQGGFRGRWRELSEEAQRRAHAWRDEHPDWPRFELYAPQFLTPGADSGAEIQALRRELEELRAELGELRSQLRDLLR